MSNDLQKYESWRAITESDFVTMFIKTWFAFVATLREFNPVEDINKIIGKGDSIFINPYLDDFERKYYIYNVFESVEYNILKVYKLGRQYVLENEKYYRFFNEDFYSLNNSFVFKKEDEQYCCTVKLKEKYVLAIRVVIKDLEYWIDEKPLIIDCEADFEDLINTPLNESIAKYFLQDEGAYIKQLSKALETRVTAAFLNKFANSKLDKIFAKKTFTRLDAFCRQVIYNALILSMSNMADDTINSENLLYHQTPCPNFIYKMTNDEPIPITDTYKWFLKFVYFLRNALFHEIIDPLEKFWQDIFKHAYLALKEILDGNIRYLKEKNAITKILSSMVWIEIEKRPTEFLPYINEHANNSSNLNIVFTDYNVKENEITLNATISLEYWTIADELKQVDLSCKATVDQTKAEFARFVLEKIDEKIINPSI